MAVAASSLVATGECWFFVFGDRARCILDEHAEDELPCATIGMPLGSREAVTQALTEFANATVRS